MVTMAILGTNVLRLAEAVERQPDANGWSAYGFGLTRMPPERMEDTYVENGVAKCISKNPAVRSSAFAGVGACNTRHFVIDMQLPANAYGTLRSYVSLLSLATLIEYPGELNIKSRRGEWKPFKRLRWSRAYYTIRASLFRRITKKLSENTTIVDTVRNKHGKAYDDYIASGRMALDKDKQRAMATMSPYEGRFDRLLEDMPEAIRSTFSLPVEISSSKIFTDTGETYRFVRHPVMLVHSTDINSDVSASTLNPDLPAVSLRDLGGVSREDQLPEGAYMLFRLELSVPKSL